MTVGDTPLIIIGASARSAAQSAIRAGYTPWCVDLFADRDLKEIAPVHRCAWEDYPHGLLEVVERSSLPRQTPLLYTGGLENYPDLINAVDRPMMGCPAGTLRKVRDVHVFHRLEPCAGLCFCDILLEPPSPSPVVSLPYLLKPMHGTGGRGIQHWHAGNAVEGEYFWQHYINGTPISALFVAENHASRFIGVTEQLIGCSMLGASGFSYCGSIAPYRVSPKQVSVLEHLGNELCRHVPIRGPFGIDMVVDDDGDIWPVEINPRYTASIEVIERMGDVCVLGMASAMTNHLINHPGGLQQDHRQSCSLADPVFGKGIVYARTDCIVSDLYELLDAMWIADVPAIGERVARGHPICTVFASGASRNECAFQLGKTAEKIYRHLALQ